MIKRSKSQVEATAYHEAGHTVICYLLSYKPQSVTIVPTVDTAGHMVIHANPLHGFQLDIDGSDEARLRIESAMTICFAGPIAQKRHNPRSWRKVHGQWDYDTIAELLCAYVALANKLLLSFDGARLLLAIWCKRTGCTLDCSLDSYLNANASTTLISTRFLCLAVE